MRKWVPSKRDQAAMSRPSAPSATAGKIACLSGADSGSGASHPADAGGARAATHAATATPHLQASGSPLMP